MGRDRIKGAGSVEAHIRINLSILESPAFIALDWTARALFLDLRNRMRSSNNGNISAALSELRHRGWTSSTTLAKALRQLEAVGLFEQSQGQCHYCAAVLTLGGKWHVEHQLPRALGGGDGEMNLVAACVPCNLSKRDRTAIEYVVQRD